LDVVVAARARRQGEREASRQQRLLVLALSLARLQRDTRRAPTPPVILADDVLGELDVVAEAGAVAGALAAGSTLAGAAGVAVVVAGVRAEVVLLARPTKPRYRPKLSRKSRTVRVVVSLERTLADSPPKTDSAAPPPRAEPMPAFALGRCIRMIRTTRRQTRKRMTTEA